MRVYMAPMAMILAYYASTRCIPGSAMGLEDHFVTTVWCSLALMLSQAFEIMEIVGRRLCLVFKGKETKPFTLMYY